jgi:hypothetical protein
VLCVYAGRFEGVAMALLAACERERGAEKKGKGRDRGERSERIRRIPQAINRHALHTAERRRERQRKGLNQ